MQKNAIRTRVLWMFIISYIIILCFPLVFSQILFSRAMQVAEDNTRSLSQVTLLRTQDSIDRIFSDLRTTGLRLTTRSQAVSLYYATLPLSPVKIENIRSLQDELRAQVTHNLYVSEIFVYFPQPQVVASSREYLGDLASFERMLWESFGMDANTFDQHIADSGTFSVQLWGKSPETQKLMVIVTSSTYIGKPDVVCVLTLQTELFRQMLSAHAEDSGYSLLWMVSPENQVLSTQARMEIAPGEEVDAAGIYAALEQNQVPENVILTVVEDAGNGWSLYGTVSAEQYLRPLRSIQVAYVHYLILCLTLGLLLAVLFSRRHYRPLRRFAQMLNLHPGTGDAGYAGLQEALGTLIQREAQNASKVRQQQHFLRQAALVRMLRGQVASPALFEALCAENGLFFSTRQFLFIGINIRETGRFFEKSIGGRQEEDDEALLRFMIVSVMDELLPLQADGYAFSMDEQMFCLVCPKCDEDAETFRDTMQSLCANAVDFIADRTGIRMTLYLSDLYRNDQNCIQALTAAARDVLWGLEQIEGFQLEEGVLTRSALEHKHSALLDASGEYRDQQQRSRFVYAALSGDLDGALDMYRKLRYCGPFPSDQSFANVQLNSAILLGLLAEEAFTPAQLSAYKTDMDGWITDLRQAKDTRELELSMMGVMRQIHQMIRAGQGPADQRAAYAKVMEYIDLHFTDSMFSVGSICRHFNFSSSYLLKLCKRHGQSGVLDAIQQRRVDAAKRLLRSTRRTVAEVAKDVGYTNTLALNRAFKRTEGITPSEYRNLVHP